MKIIDYIEDNFPTYALCYVVNGDASGIDTEDQEACDAWSARLEAQLRRDYPDAVDITLLFEDGDGDEFTPCPAFGLACGTVKCAYAVFVENDDPRKAFALPWEEEE